MLEPTQKRRSANQTEATITTNSSPKENSHLLSPHVRHPSWIDSIESRSSSSSSSATNNAFNYGTATAQGEEGHGTAGDVENGQAKHKSHLSLVIAMSIGIFLAAIDGTIVVSSYTAIGSELKQLQSTNWIATAYLLTLTSFQPLYGKLSDIFGRKPCLLVAYSIFALGSLLCGLASTMDSLIAARALAGIGGGGMTTIVTIIMSDVVPLRQRGTWQGVLNIIYCLGAACGAPLGGFLADGIGWRWTFLLQIPIALLAILSVSLTLHLPPHPPSNFFSKLMRIDFPGAVTLIVSVFTLLLSLDMGTNHSWFYSPYIPYLTPFLSDVLHVSLPLPIALLVIAILFALLFSHIEINLASEPFAPKHIIFSSCLLPAFLVNFFAFAAGMSSIFHVSLWLQAVLGRTATETGAWLVLGVVGSLVGSLSGGMGIQKTGRYYWLTLAFYWSLAFGLLILVVGTSDTESLFVEGTEVGLLTRMVPVLGLVGGLGAGLFISALGNGGGVTTSLIALISNANQADQAIATAASYLFRSLGYVIGLAIGGTIVQDILKAELKTRLSGRGQGEREVDEIIQSVRQSLNAIGKLDPEVRSIVRLSYANAIHGALWFSLFLALCGALASVYIHEKPIAAHAPASGSSSNDASVGNGTPATNGSGDERAGEFVPAVQECVDYTEEADRGKKKGHVDGTS